MYKVKHRKVDSNGNTIEVVSGSFVSRRTAENLILDIARSYEYRGAEIVSSNAKSLKPRAKKEASK